MEHDAGREEGKSTPAGVKRNRFFIRLFKSIWESAIVSFTIGVTVCLCRPRCDSQKPSCPCEKALDSKK
jgi:hypothetical protein